MRIGIAAISVCLTLWAAVPAAAAPTRIAFSGRVGFVPPAGGASSLVRLGDPLSGILEVDLDAVQPGLPTFATDTERYVLPVERFDLLVGDASAPALSVAFSGDGGVSVIDESTTFSADLVRLALNGLTANPALGSGGELRILMDFGDETRAFIQSTDFLFPTDDANWTGIGFVLNEVLSPSFGLEAKFIGRITSWQVVPEPGSAALLAFGLASLGCFPLRGRRRIS